jgi:alpha-tubulin suppressor-like RCC1 family protein
MISKPRAGLACKVLTVRGSSRCPFPMNRLLPPFHRMNAICRRFSLLGFALFLSLAGVESPAALPRKVGDTNNDGELSVVDLTLLRRHVRGLDVLAPADQPFADVNQDGVVNEDDARALIRLLTGEDNARALPLNGIRETSPQNGEESVSSSRRTGIILRFAMPVQASEVFHDRAVFSASVNGVRLRTRAELSSDGRKLALFPVDEIPANENGGVRIPAEKIPGNARVDVRLNTAGIKDLLGREIDGDGDGQPGGVFNFYYLTESLVVVPNTEIKGKIFASEKRNGQNVPLQGVIVRVAGTENAQVFTDVNGAFTLPCPAGRFFAEVDGRKVLGENAFPDKDYYPYVVKAWEAVAGSKENLAVGTGEIFLPVIPAGALKAVDPTKDTKVQAAASIVEANLNFADISLNVPAGALRKEDGTSGGKIGMAPVPPDRLPEPLAPGLEFPVVITIQTDGAGTFDQPVAVKFPNLPDQNGNTLKAGEKTGLWSFNHDTGSWELQGPMTVTDDGKYVTTDPGVGVRQPGWHGVLPGSQGVGPKRAVSAPELPGWAEKEVFSALTIAAQSSLPVRDAFLALGEMRSAAEDLEQTVRLLQELRSMIAAYEEFNDVSYWWSAEWFQQRITKLKDSYSRILPGGSGDLLAALNRMQPQLDALRRYLNALEPFNQRAYADPSYTWLSTQFAESNAALLWVLNSIQPYLDSLRAGVPLFSREAFNDVSRILTRGFNQPALSRSQEMDALTRFVVEMQPVLDFVAFDHSEQLRTLKLQMSDYLARAGALSIAVTKPNKYGYIKVDAVGEPQRVRSNAAGDYRMVLPPDREFAVTYVDPKTLQVGAYVGISGWNGTITELYGPVLAPLQPNVQDPVDLAYAKDTDGDKLADALELVIGTDAAKVDTDSDGSNDFREVTRGKNPLSGLAVGTGVIFSASTSRQGYESTDVDAGNELLFVSEGRTDGPSGGGLMVYSLESKTEPLRQAFLSLDYPVYRVRYADTNLAVLALHEHGTAVVDVSSPTNPVVLHHYAGQPGESVESAILVGDILVLGVNDSNTESARIVLKALESGETIREQYAGGSISDLLAEGTVVYALSKGNRSANEWWFWNETSAVYVGDVSRAREPLAEGESLFMPVNVREWEYSKSGGRLALAAGKLFYVYESGLTVLDLANPLAPVLEGDVFKPESGFQLGWRHVLFDGSVDASKRWTFLAALGSSGRGNPDEDGDVAVFKYGQAKDFGDSTSVWWAEDINANTPMAQFVTQFDSRVDRPRQENLASGRVYCIAIAGGIVYAADREQGLKVINYRKYDSEGKVPALAIRSNSPSPSTDAVLKVQEGTLLALTARPVDDVAVASVEWYVDGVRVAVTGGAPWGYTTRLPMLADGTVKQLRVEARAYDTGGNMTASERIVEVVRDSVPPAVLQVTPVSSVASLSGVSVEFSEPMEQASLAGSLKLVSAGADGALGTADDFALLGGTLSAGSVSLALNFPTTVPEGTYRAVLSGSVTDLAGNTLGADYTWEFGVGLANTWKGGRGLWSDASMWTLGVVPVSGESVVFPAGVGTNLIVGGRAAFRPAPENMVAGRSIFSRVLTKDPEGVVNGMDGFYYSSITPISVGMVVTGSMVAEGTYVKSASVTEEWSDFYNQIQQTTVFELSQPLVEGIYGPMTWGLISGGSLGSVTVKGDTALVDVDLVLSGSLSVSNRFAFGGDSSLSVSTLTTSGSAALLSAAAALDTGSLLAGKTHSGAARLKLTQPLVLSGSLALESAGFRAADGKLTNSSLQLSSSLDLAGHELRVSGGYAGSLAFQKPVGGGTFALTGPGRLAFDWKDGLFDEPGADWDNFRLRVSTAELVLPEDVTLDVAGLGHVSFFATKLTNYGTVKVANQGRLKVYNYERVGNAAKELLGQDALFEVLVAEPGDETVSSFSSNYGLSFALKQDGSLWAWGQNAMGQLGQDSWGLDVGAPVQVGTDTDWKSVNTFYSSTLALKKDGSLWAWGFNDGGRLGVGSRADYVMVPTQVGADTDWKSVSTAYGVTFALKQDGSLWAWGYNGSGRLAVGRPEEVVADPMQVGIDMDWKSVTTDGSSIALKRDGSVWAWGYNGSGQLGLGGSEEFVGFPTQIGTSTDWTFVTASAWSNFALKQDGSLWAWGLNDRGQLGVGSFEERITVPTQVGTDSDWKSVRVSGRRTFALKQDGSLWAWGDNYERKLGVGSFEERIAFPTQVGTDKDWQSVYADNTQDSMGLTDPDEAFALKQDGSLWAWGDNHDVKLGVGSWEPVVYAPMQVGSDTDWKSVTMMGNNEVTYAQKKDGSLWAWGRNYGGILGVGSADSTVTVPTQVGVFADRFAPAVLPVSLPSVRRQVSSVSFAFGEPMDRSTFIGSLTLRSAGPDGRLGTADDVAVQGGILTGGDSSVSLDFANPLPDGLYRAVLSASAADLAGNALGADYTWDFGVAQTNAWLGGRGLWSDSAMWSYGMVPVPGEAVVFPAGAEPNVVVGGRTTYRPDAASLLAGNSTFNRASGFATPVRVGMLVTGSMVAEGTYVKSVVVTEMVEPVQGQYTVFELSKPLVEGVPGPMTWALISGGSLDSVAIKGDTALVDVDLVLSGSLSVSDRLAFGGASSLSVGTLTTSGSAALLSAAAAVETGSLVAGKTNSGAARLKLTQPLVLSGSLTLESTGVRVADGTLTSSWVQLSSGLDLAGHELRVHGGYAGSVALQAPVAGGTFALTGPGKLAFDWKESLLDAEDADWDKLSMSVNADNLVHPQNMTLEVGGLGQVSILATRWTNYGTVAVSEQGWLKAYNYEKVGDAAKEIRGQDAVFEVLSVDLLDQEGKLSSKYGQTFAVKQDGSLWAWGSNWGGALGVGSTEEYVTVPTQVGTDTDWMSVSGGVYTFALKQNGSLWAWGNNDGGILGVSSTEQYVTVPTQVGTDTDWRSVSGGGCTFALKQNGSLWAWGNNDGGILGVSSTERYVTAPAQVGTDMDWRSVSGGGCSFALKQNGSLWAWGNNDGGILGVGSTEQYITAPTQVGTDTDWSSASGGGCNFALKQNGSLWAWGNNDEGFLGVGISSGRVNIPLQVGNDLDWVSVKSSGSGYTFAKKRDGGMWGWGNNWSGILGLDSASIFVATPTRLGSDTDWTFVSLTGDGATAIWNAVAQKRDGSLWAWGTNTGGILGVGSTADVVTTPTQVGTDNDWAR